MFEQRAPSACPPRSCCARPNALSAPLNPSCEILRPNANDAEPSRTQGLTGSVQSNHLWKVYCEWVGSNPKRTHTFCTETLVTCVDTSMRLRPRDENHSIARIMSER